MAYTIIKSDGTLLTTIADGTINVTSTSIGLPGRNYAGYGQTLDTNFVHQLENFADTTPPANPLKGQLWFNTNNNTMCVCPSDGETDANNWLALSSASSGGSSTFGNLTVTSNIAAGNITATGTIEGLTGIFTNLTVVDTGTFANIDVTINATVGNLLTNSISSGSNSTAGDLTGVWTANGSGLSTFIATNGNIVIPNPGANLYGIRTDRYMYANGDTVNFGTNYTDSNVRAYLPTNTATVNAPIILTPNLTTSLTLSTVAGSITGNWTLSPGSRLNATYADLAERFEADDVYDAGTVVEMGGMKEVTAVKTELSEDVFGVVSMSAGYVMNAGAGNDDTHPAVAVSGRVPVKVIGKVKRNSRLVSAGNGIARQAKQGEATAFNVIGRALTDKTTDGVGSIEAFVTIK